jgi:hypothetical protein
MPTHDQPHQNHPPHPQPMPKAFWLKPNSPHLAAPPDLAAQRRLPAGQDVDRLARAQFPGGILISYRPRPRGYGAPD